MMINDSGVCQLQCQSLVNYDALSVTRCLQYSIMAMHLRKHAHADTIKSQTPSPPEHPNIKLNQDGTLTVPTNQLMPCLTCNALMTVILRDIGILQCQRCGVVQNA